MAEQAVAKPKVTLHWLNKSRSQRIVWLLQECHGCDWDLKIYNRMENHLAPPELKKIHPLGHSPVISVEGPGSSTPVVLAESGAIVEYLSEYFAPHLVPKRYHDGKEGQVGGETEQWVRYRFFMHYAEGSLMSMLLLAMILDMISDGPKTPWLIKPIARAIASNVYSAFLADNLKTQFTFLEQQLATSPDSGQFLCGKNLTGADILLSFPLIAAKLRKKFTEAQYPKLAAYTDLLESQEGYKASVRKIEEVSGEKFSPL